MKNLKDDSNNYLSLTELQEKYSLISCPLNYYSLLSALKYLWNIHRNKCDTNNFEYESFSSRLMQANKTSPLVYNKLIEKKSIRPTQSQQKWKSDCNLNNDERINWPGVRHTYWHPKVQINTRLN